MLLDSQKYSECQLVTAINAAVYLGEQPVEPGSVEYERLVDMVGARYGSAFRISHAHLYLRIQRKILRPRWSVIRRALAAGRPVEGNVWHPTVGFHSVLFTSYQESSRLQYLRVWNFRSGALNKEWVTWSWLKSGFRRHSFLRGGDVWEFDLVPWHEKKMEHKRHVHKCAQCNMGWPDSTSSLHSAAASRAWATKKRRTK